MRRQKRRAEKFCFVLGYISIFISHVMHLPMFVRVVWHRNNCLSAPLHNYATLYDGLIIIPALISNHMPSKCGIKRLYRWSLEIDKWYCPIHYNVCNYLFVMVSNLRHVSKRGPLIPTRGSMSMFTVISSQTLLGMWLLIHAGIKVNPCL